MYSELTREVIEDWFSNQFYNVPYTIVDDQFVTETRYMDRYAREKLINSAFSGRIYHKDKFYKCMINIDFNEKSIRISIAPDNGN